MGIYHQLCNLADLRIGETICREYGVTVDDLELISLVLKEERAFQQELEEEKRRNHGGSETDHNG